MMSSTTICGIGALALCAGNASAQLMVFTDRGAWETAVGGSWVLEDFNTTAVQTIADGATLDTGLLQVTRDGSMNDSDGDLEIRDGGSFGNVDGTNFLFGETGESPHESVHFGFNGQDVYAFGADFVSPFSGDGIVISAGGEILSLVDIGTGSSFFGFVNTGGGAVGDVSILGDPGAITFQELWQADNVVYAVVPAPAGLALLGIGSALVLRRKR